MGKLEKEIALQIQREEAESKFNEGLLTLEKKKQSLVEVAAKAEMQGDSASADLAIDNILYIQETMSLLRRNKMNFDIIELSGDISMIMESAFTAIEQMAKGGVTLPNYKKIKNTREKLAKYMRETAFAQKMVGKMMTSSNPATRTPRTDAERASVKDLIAAERAKISGSVPSGGTSSIYSAINAEKNAKPNG